MTGEGNDRGGVKAPRTLFSLGRPGTKRPRDGAESTATVDEEITIDEAVEEMEIQYACGACGALLPSGASFCGECGTPVAIEDDEVADHGMLDELSDFDESTQQATAFDQEVLPGQEPLAESPSMAAVDLDETLTADETIAAETIAAETIATETIDEQAPMEGAVTAGAGETDAFDAQAEPATDVEPIQAAGAHEVEAAGPILDSQQPVGSTSAGGEGGEPVAAGGYAGDQDSQGANGDVEITESGAPPAEPAAVLYADPSIAEPLPPPAEGTWAVSEPLVGTTQGDAVAQDSGSMAPDAGVGMAGAAVAGMAGFAAPEIESPPEDAELAGDQALPGETATTWTIAPEAPAGSSGDQATATSFVGTTATAMPYGAGPVETSQAGSKALVVVAAVVVGVLLLGGIAFALTRGGSSDVATQPSSTPTTAKKADPNAAAKASTTSQPKAESSTTETSVSSTESTTTPTSEDSASTATTNTASVTSQTTTRGQPQPTTQQTITTPGPTSAQPAAINFNGPGSYRLGKGGSTSFTVTNSGGSPGDFHCSGNGIQVTPSSGSLNVGGSQSVVIQDFRNAGARYTISCVGAGGSRYSAEVIVDN